MKYAVISDIHANLEALQSVLKYILSKNIHKIYCLGDIVGYGPRPNECVELVRKRCEFCLMGNHDHAVLGLTDIYYFNQYAKEAVLWTRKAITQHNKAYLENLPFTQETDTVFFVHSTPLEPAEWHYIFSDRDAQQNFKNVSQPITFIGHSHIPVIFSYHRGTFYDDTIKLDLTNDRYIVNVGSVGQPRDGDPRACFVIIDEEKSTLDYVRLDYPVKKTYQEIMDNNLPPFLAMRLLAGQ